MRRNHLALSLATLLPGVVAACWAIGCLGSSAHRGPLHGGDEARCASPPASMDSSTAERQRLEAEFYGRSVEELLVLMRNPRPEVRAAATKNLGTPQRACPALEPYFVALLGDPDPAVRRCAAFGVSLTAGQCPEAVPALARLMESEDLSMRIGAATALGRYGSDAAAATAALREGLDSDSPMEAMVCAASLGAIAREGGYVESELVRRLESSDPHTRQLAVDGLIENGALAAGEVSERLDSRRGDVRESAGACLAGIRDA